MSRRAALLLLAMLAPQPLFAQQQPFDMTPEGSKPAPQVQPAQLEAPPPAEAPPSEASAPFKRYLLPSGEFILSGENVTRSWSIYLTAEQAASEARLVLGYQNAVIVAPEASRLKLTINGKVLLDLPIESSEAVADRVAALPVNLLRAGFNDIRIEAVQRHRTDCTTQSTYELWTEIDPAHTYLEFADAAAGQWKRFDDIRSVGVSETGATAFNVVVPALTHPGASKSTMRLSQGLALMADMPNQSFSIQQDSVPEKSPGSATVVIGTASELRDVISALPPGAETEATAVVLDDPRFGPSTLVVTGPSWASIDSAIEILVNPLDRPVAVQRKDLATKAWRTPDVPMLYESARLKFTDLGVATQEFAGRRFRSDFAVGVPSDFFANEYGEATILLDAAYSPEVLPGSHIDIYVNDNIASTVPITASGGEILRHLPIKVTMRHFQPGLNTIAIEAVLLTQADEVCAPGATALTAGRFVLFDTSEFVMPDFARIGQLPNLAALGGTGFPYSRAPTPTAMVIDNDDSSMSAAATLLARLSVAAGRLVPIDLPGTAAPVADQNVIYVGPISQAPAAMLAQVGVTEASRTSWSQSVADAAGSEQPDTKATFDQWRDRLSGSGWRGQISVFEDWLNRTFNVSIDTFQFIPTSDAEFTPSGNATLLVAQQASPLQGGTWTLVTAPSADMLTSGVQALTTQSRWHDLGGHITTYAAATGKVERVSVGKYSFVATRPASFSNYRLIAANWLSANALSYSLVLAVLSVLLGLATVWLLARLGRKA